MDDLNVIKRFRGGPVPMPVEREETVRARLREIADTREPRPRRRVALRVGVAACLTVAVGTGLTLVQSLDGDGGPAASAAEFGDRAARAIEDRPYSAPDPKQWVYVKARTAGGFEMNTWWKGVDRSWSEPVEHWERIDELGVAFISYRTKQLVVDYRTTETGSWISPKGNVGYRMRNYHTLPTEPDALLRKLYAVHYPNQVGKTRHDDVFEMLDKMLQNPISPKLQAAVYRALPKIPGVTLRRDVPDLIGRTGDAFAHVNHLGERTSILIDPKTYRYLGTGVEAARDIPVNGEGPGKNAVAKAGTVLRWNSLITAKIVNGPGQR
ncbi:CU044_5270 family protein [Spirillospora sp. CA-294931]|uniref:CU044_5270 family protein n=1 Tax=Spirillospora sp. CA-294931 TaxID=3240042 RepID=UPI003D8A4FF6